MQRRQRTRFRQIVLNQIKELKWKVLFVGLFVLSSTMTGLLAPWPLKIIFDNILLDKPLSPILSFLGASPERKGILSGSYIHGYRSDCLYAGNVYV